MNQRQAIIVLIRLIEFVFSDGCMAIIHTPTHDIKLEKLPKGGKHESQKTHEEMGQM